MICEITNATGNIYKDWWGQQSSIGSFKLTKAIHYIYLPGNGEFENLCFVSVAWTMSVSRMFVYSAVDINKIATAFLAKLAP